MARDSAMMSAATAVSGGVAAPSVAGADQPVRGAERRGAARLCAALTPVAGAWAASAGGAEVIRSGASRPPYHPEPQASLAILSAGPGAVAGRRAGRRRHWAANAGAAACQSIQRRASSLTNLCVTTVSLIHSNCKRSNTYPTTKRERVLHRYAQIVIIHVYPVCYIAKLLQLSAALSQLFEQR